MKGEEEMHPLPVESFQNYLHSGTSGTEGGLGSFE